MAAAVLAAGVLRAALPPELRVGDARWLFLAVVVVLLAALIAGDPGRIDRDVPWLRLLTGMLIGVISVVNAGSAVRLVIGIVDGEAFTDNAKLMLASGGIIWMSNVIAFALWYWDLDQGGPVARASATPGIPALIFPEMKHPDLVGADWYPKFVDYFHFSFATATAFSPTDVSAIKPWMKLMLMAEEAISLVVALLVVARAVNILK
jgi:uncharacterized membrane protein